MCEINFSYQAHVYLFIADKLMEKGSFCKEISQQQHKM